MHLFPIDSIKEKILSSLETKDFLIIKSTPGSGKTTRVPLFLREKYKKKIYILEPRKLAAKLASMFVAKSIGEQPGNSVGHVFKYERAVTDNTQIIFLTEGTFLRILASDPELKDCDVVILDEFHERHYYTDVALSFLLKIKESNKNLKVIIMSATIDLKELDVLLLDKAATVELNESKHSLKIEYLPNDTLVLKDPLERKIYNALLKAADRPGHILVFLPGMFEIQKAEEIARNNFNHEIVILHGEVAGVTIDDSFYDLTKKKIILSTNIAESSVTIPGVRTVIDAGLHKINKLNPVTRLPFVELRKISQSSAIQRANRSSREDDGHAYRLYSEFDYQSRDQFDVPEINRVDLSELMITTADIFNSSIEDFTFLATLNAAEVDKSKKYLEQIGLFENGLPTKLAKRLSRFPFHPRISKILDEASKGNEETFNHVVSYLADLVEPRSTSRFRNLVKNFFKATPNGPSIDLEKIILFGYIDQLAKLKSNQLVHMNGEVYTISPRLNQDIDPNHPLWIILDLDNRNQVTRLLSIEEEWLYDLPSFPIEESEKIDFDVDNLKLSVERLTKVGAIVLSKEKAASKELSSNTLDFVAKKLMPAFKDKMESNTFKRLYLLEKYTEKKIADYPLLEWFKGQVPYLLADSQYNLDIILNACIDEVFNYLNQDSQYDLEHDLPVFLQLHDKRKVEIHYDSTNGIHSESYVQDFYGLTDVPAILKGKEKIKIHLIGPHKRALQVTTDLMSFWDRAYKELHGELKRDYPRHYWPLDPKNSKPILLLKNVK
ncbi:MAG: DEAD/DEAH box helicase [Rhizobacter sp.]|nr:DEAD/DEAH box helicase [Bacteriovorax sp.]